MDRIESIILRGLMYDEQYMRRVLPFIETEYFLEKSERTIFTKLKGFIDSFNIPPTKEALIIDLDNTHGVDQDELDEMSTYLGALETERADQPNPQWLIERTEEWCQEKAIHNAILEALNILGDKSKKHSKGSIPKLLQDALGVSFDPHVGHDYINDSELRFDFYHRVESRIPFHLDYFNKITKNGVPNKTLNIVLAGVGCHKKDTPILMSNGQLRPVQDIAVGDVLVGPDGNARTVTRLVRGRDTMYQVKVNRTNDTFEVNAGHILSLVHTVTGQRCDISVSDYLKRSKKFQDNHKLYYCKTPIEFNNNPRLTIPPYFLGVLLGDGSTHNTAVTTADQEIVTAVNSFADDWGMSIRTTNNGSIASTYHLRRLESYGFGQNFNILAEELKVRYGLLFNQSDQRTSCGKKFIPEPYKTAPIKARLELMAGLIDTDGSRVKGGYELTSKSEALVQDFVFVAHSLGYIAHYSERIIGNSTYYRAHIGLTDFCVPISTRIPRKTLLPVTPRKDRSRHGFKITELVEDDYYGFQVDRDHLYVMGNFLVTHNCGKSLYLCDLAANYLMQGKNVLYITLEMAQERIAERIDANLMDRPLDELAFMNAEVFQRHINRIHERTKGTLIIKEYPTAMAHVGHFRHLLNELNLKKQFKPDAIFIDYLNICASSRVKPSSSGGLYELVKGIAEELRGMAVEFDVPIWSATQMNRAGFNNSDPDITNTSESFGLPATADFMFALINSDELKGMNQLLVKVLKNRYGDIYMRNNQNGQLMTKFVVGIDRSKQKLFNLENSAQNGLSQDDDIDETPPVQRSPERSQVTFEIDRPFNSADDEAERRRANTQAGIATYRPKATNSTKGKWNV